MSIDSSNTNASVNKVNFTVARQWGQLIGTNIRTYDDQDKLLCFAKQKAFKLREEVTFYSDESQSNVLFKVKARNIVDLAGTYDMFDLNNNLMGSIRRKGIASTFVRDEWLILDNQEREIGQVTEDSLALGVARRFIDFVALLIPQTYDVSLNGQVVGSFKQVRNPFKVKYICEISSDIFRENNLLILAIPNLLAIIEARQN